MTDRFGLGWRYEYGADLLRNLDRIDLVEVIADGWLLASRSRLRTLQSLAASVPVSLHGVGLGLASVSPLQSWRLDAWARLVDVVRPQTWSEHLAFVRSDGVEIGHLAAPPRQEAFVEGALANIERARRAVGTLPLLENIATLVEPLGSTMDESAWIAGIVRGCDGHLLLDLHNLYANAANEGENPRERLASMPLEAVRQVHIAGGRLVEAPAPHAPRVLDDHLHDTPDIVFSLLEWLAARCPQPLVVILERDGQFPPFEAMLAELDVARAAVARGRAVRAKPLLSESVP
jgi:uncharacterized protein (UPF0276 family)